MRRLRVLVERLPGDSAVVREKRGTPWSEADYLLALIADHLAFYRHDFARAHGGTPSEPKPLRRPEDGDPEDNAALMRAAHDDVMAQLKGVK